MNLKQMAGRLAAFWIGTEHEKRAHGAGVEAGARALLEYARGEERRLAIRNVGSHVRVVLLGDLEALFEEDGK